MIVSWNTTNACNLKCQHCYRDAGNRAEDELTTEQARQMIRQIAEAGFKIMIFSGGEPLMRPDIEELIAFAKAQGLRPVLGSNGTLISLQKAKSLKAAGLMAAGISLDSPYPQEHDRFRGVDGSWLAALAGIKYCREAGLPFQLHTTVMDWNYGQIEELTDLAVDLGARGHHIFFLVPTGRAIDIAEESLRADRYEALLRRIMQKQQEVDIELKPTCAPQFMRIARQMGLETRFKKGCLAGTSYCIVNPVGKVQPCAYLEIEAGQVKEQSFKDIWQNSPVLQRLRQEKLAGGCGECQYQGICGGCRARAYYYYGDYMAEEPWCLYRMEKNNESSN